MKQTNRTPLSRPARTIEEKVIDAMYGHAYSLARKDVRPTDRLLEASSFDLLGVGCG